MATLFKIICLFALKPIKQLSYAKRMDIHKLFQKILKVVEYHLINTKGVGICSIAAVAPPPHKPGRINVFAIVFFNQ